MIGDLAPDVWTALALLLPMLGFALGAWLGRLNERRKARRATEPQEVLDALVLAQMEHECLPKRPLEVWDHPQTCRDCYPDAPEVQRQGWVSIHRAEPNRPRKDPEAWESLLGYWVRQPQTTSGYLTAGTITADYIHPPQEYECGYCGCYHPIVDDDDTWPGEMF